MNEKLASIFVPVEVAKLAKEKGFNEWCACMHLNNTGYIPNDDNHCDWDFEFIGNGVFINIPTHYQLIKWLNEKHHIDLVMSTSGLFNVVGFDGLLGRNKNGDTYNEINEALTIALNLIELVNE